MQRALNKGQQANGVKGQTDTTGTVEYHTETNGTAEHHDLDAVIIGGGFAGVYVKTFRLASCSAHV